VPKKGNSSIVPTGSQQNLGRSVRSCGSYFFRVSRGRGAPDNGQSKSRKNIFRHRGSLFSCYGMRGNAATGSAETIDERGSVSGKRTADTGGGLSGLFSRSRRLRDRAKPPSHVVPAGHAGNQRSDSTLSRTSTMLCGLAAAATATSRYHQLRQLRRSSGLPITVKLER
jgi:hypothetical protein